MQRFISGGLPFTGVAAAGPAATDTPVPALVKFANFRRNSVSFPSVQKLWAQAEFAY